MKNYIALFALGVLLAGCQDATDKAADSKATTDKAAATQADTSKNDATKSDGPKSANQQALDKMSDADKMAYAIGANMADGIASINRDFNSMGIDINVVKKGFEGEMSKTSIMTDEQVREQLQSFQQKMRTAQQEKMHAEIEAKKTENEAYFAKLEEKGGYTKTESGLYYKVITPAKEGAAKPSATDTVKVHYTGTFTDGEQFDSSVGKEPFKFSLRGGVIQGWIEGVKYMDVGSKYQFVIPPELGYGERDRGPIPGGSILVFDVELLEIVQPEKADTTAKGK
ncbi:FKBP-type peptidyl-prolyl cis-trans isomerase [Aliikangiella maris]|uniref:Peptidyl-prolyl cis-trans isomerase n=2 Tax=Aliikangiella maris TaxID=3162458 RepID=A0ABV3MR82_9GAMM